VKIQMISFDVAGTTVIDDGLVIRAFQKAFGFAVPLQWEEHQKEWTQYAKDTMGQSKIEVFTALLGRPDLAREANAAFEGAYLDLVLTEGIDEIPGATELFKNLKAAGFQTALTTGFSRNTLNAILKKLSWQDLLGATVTPPEVGAGRPSPKMLQKVAADLGVTNPEACVVVGDTVSDVEAGLAFGAGVVIGVLSGAHNLDALLGAGATSVVNSVAELQSLLLAETL
jgi:phosphoglycolate phosphatase